MSWPTADAEYSCNLQRMFALYNSHGIAGNLCLVEPITLASQPVGTTPQVTKTRLNEMQRLLLHVSNWMLPCQSPTNGRDFP